MFNVTPEFLNRIVASSRDDAVLVNPLDSSINLMFDELRINNRRVAFCFEGKEICYQEIPTLDLRYDTLSIKGINGSTPFSVGSL